MFTWLDLTLTDWLMISEIMVMSFHDFISFVQLSWFLTTKKKQRRRLFNGLWIKLGPNHFISIQTLLMAIIIINVSCHHCRLVVIFCEWSNKFHSVNHYQCLLELHSLILSQLLDEPRQTIRQSVNSRVISIICLLFLNEKEKFEAKRISSWKR